MTIPEKPDGEALVLNAHCISNFLQRSGGLSAVTATDEIRRLFKLTTYAGAQEEPRGRHPKKALRAAGKDRHVTIWHVIEGCVQWVFYVRGRVLLTVHRHDVKRKEVTSG